MEDATQNDVVSFGITGSSTRYGIQMFIMPSTSPILIWIVMSTTISLGGTIWANCGFVSIVSKFGRNSTTLLHASRK